MKKIFLLFAMGFLLFSCGSDDSEEMDELKATMEVKKNGVSFTGSGFNNTLLTESSFGDVGRRLDLRANVDGGILIVSVSNWEWQNPPLNGVFEKFYDTNVVIGENAECMETNTATLCDGGLVTYLVGTTIYISEEIDDAGPGLITISKVDAENKRVSGSFESATIDFITDEIITFSGTFENLSYRVL